MAHYVFMKHILKEYKGFKLEAGLLSKTKKDYVDCNNLFVEKNLKVYFILVLLLSSNYT